MTAQQPGFRFISGDTGIMVIAPHGPFMDGVFYNDLRTGVIAEKIQEELGCCALINDRFLKPIQLTAKDASRNILDMFKTGNAAKVSGYMDAILQVADSSGPTLVVWVHGIADNVAVKQGQEHIAAGLFSKEAAELHALIGFGQGGDPKSGNTGSNLSARPDTAARFCDRLTSRGMTTLLAREKSDNFRGRDAKRLNQWFLQAGYGHDQVESIQLEIREKDFRDSIENAVKSAAIISEALTSFA